MNDENLSDEELPLTPTTEPDAAPAAVPVPTADRERLTGQENIVMLGGTGATRTVSVELLVEDGEGYVDVAEGEIKHLQVDGMDVGEKVKTSEPAPGITRISASGLSDGARTVTVTVES